MNTIWTPGNEIGSGTKVTNHSPAPLPDDPPRITVDSAPPAPPPTNPNAPKWHPGGAVGSGEKIVEY
jgi:hypothetical protein